MTKWPLEGIRVYFIGTYWAGPMCCAMLSDMGAEVVHQETQARVDPWRLGGEGVASDPELGPAAQVLGRNKLSILLNPTKPGATELAKAVIKHCDIVVENNKAGLMKKWGLDYDSLKEVKPDIIMCSISSFGQSGPYSTVGGTGQAVTSLSGLGILQGYYNEEPLGMVSPYPDPTGGVAAFFAIMAALRYRRNTGKGQFIDVALTESMGAALGGGIMDYIMNGRVATCMGNHSSWMAPQGCYRCNGDDDWLTIACSTDEEWQALCQATGNPQWAEDERFADNYARLNNWEELDKLISGWTINHTSHEAMEMLQRAGIAATPVFNTAELVTDPHQLEEKYYVHLPHPRQPLCHVYTNPWKLSETPGGPYRPAALLGEHSEEIFCKLGGLSKEEFDRLVEEKVIW